MSFRMLQIGCFSIVVVVGSLATRSVQAQYPFGGPNCSKSYGYNNQSFYGQPGYGQTGMFHNQGGNFGQNYYAPPTGYAPQQSLGYGGGYAQPSVNLNQSFYPSGNGYNAFAPRQNYPSHHSHHSDHTWHPGHYLLGL